MIGDSRSDSIVAPWESGDAKATSAEWDGDAQAEWDGDAHEIELCNAA